MVTLSILVKINPQSQQKNQTKSSNFTIDISEILIQSVADIEEEHSQREDPEGSDDDTDHDISHEAEKLANDPTEYVAQLAINCTKIFTESIQDSSSGDSVKEQIDGSSDYLAKHFFVYES